MCSTCFIACVVRITARNPFGTSGDRAVAVLAHSLLPVLDFLPAAIYPIEIYSDERIAAFERDNAVSDALRERINQATKTAD